MPDRHLRSAQNGINQLGDRTLSAPFDVASKSPISSFARLGGFVIRCPVANA